MITISNSQRDYIVKCLNELHELLKQHDGLRAANMRRRVKILRRQLEAKKPNRQGFFVRLMAVAKVKRTDKTNEL